MAGKLRFYDSNGAIKRELYYDETDSKFKLVDAQSNDVQVLVDDNGKVEIKVMVVVNEFRLPVTRPDNPSVGSMYFDPSTGELYVYDGSTWKKVTLS